MYHYSVLRHQSGHKIISLYNYYNHDIRKSSQA